MIKEPLNLGLLYLSLHNQMRKKWGVNRIVSKKDFYAFLGRHFLIPKHIRDASIIELERMDLLERVDKHNIKIKGLNFNLEEDNQKIYNKFYLL